MFKLKVEINVNLPQLLCIVVSVALNGEFERFGGFCIDCYYTFIMYSNRQRKTHKKNFEDVASKFEKTGNFFQLSIHFHPCHPKRQATGSSFTNPLRKTSYLQIYLKITKTFTKRPKA